MSDRARKIVGKDTGIGLHEAILTLTSELSLEMVLQLAADLSRRLVQAAYSALGRNSGGKNRARQRRQTIWVGNRLMESDR